MRGNLLDSAISDEDSQTQSRGLLMIGAVSALLVTALVFAGFLLLRSRQQQTVRAQQAQIHKSTEPKGPAKAQILVDEPLLNGDQTVLGGTVKNLSSENLTGLLVELELIRRKDAGTQRISVAVQPSQIAPQQEGHYSVQLRSADYSSVKLAGLNSGAGPTALAYTSAPGQKRPPEKIASKTIIVNQPSRPNNGFLNTPDTPGRIR
jgi:hypothetical protein